MMELHDFLSPAVVDESAPHYQRPSEDESQLISDPGSLKRAAVLIAVTARPDPGVLFVQRPDHMRNHPGQVAFPGGRMDDADGGDPVRGALREAHEELAIPPDQVSVLGPTDRFLSGSGYNIQPVIGIIPPDLPLIPDSTEVASWFEAPLDFILDRNNYQKREVEWQGQMRHYYDAKWQGYRIWGVTAGMIQNLASRLGR